MSRIVVRHAFSRFPGPRFTSQGKFSGELFREQFLLPKVRHAVDSGEMLTVDLTGLIACGTSFLEEAFGGLIRENKYQLAQLQPVLEIKCDDRRRYVDEISRYMQAAEDERRAAGEGGG